MRATIRDELRNAGCVVTSSTRSPYAQISRPSRIDSSYSAPVIGSTAEVVAGSEVAVMVLSPLAGGPRRPSHRARTYAPGRIGTTPIVDRLSSIRI
jgi:hypothetical protein